MQSINSKLFTLIEIVAFSSLMIYLYINRHNVPLLDEWEMTYLVDLYQKGELNLSLLNFPHNDCRMLYPHLINLFVILITKWQSFYLVAFNMVMFFIFYLIFKRELKQIIESKSTIVVNVLFLGCFVMIYSFKNYESIIMGFSINYYLSVIATFGGLIVLKKITWRNVVISCFLVHVATLSYVTGLLSWVCVMLLIFFSNVTRPQKVQYILFVLCCLLVQVYFYFTNYYSTSPITERTMDLTKIIPYSLAFLSNNLTVTPSKAIVFSVIQLLTIITAFYLQYKSEREKFYQSLPFMAFGLFGILTSLMTAYGRAVEGTGQSLSRRYCVLSLPFTLIFFVSVIILITHLEKWKKPKYIQNTVAGLTVLLLGYLLSSQIRYLQLAEDRNKEIMVGKEHILRGDYQHSSIRNVVYPIPERLDSRVEVLKKYQLSLYNQSLVK